ncbi:MAG TPA: hypothetical protein VLS96_03830 [Nodosilinea sp.]|nr:hypothetical protein [Nodosilinea sp.]
MALIDRAKLLQTLIALPPQQFSQIEFALKPPDGIMPGITASRHCRLGESRGAPYSQPSAHRQWRALTVPE